MSRQVPPVTTQTSDTHHTTQAGGHPEADHHAAPARARRLRSGFPRIWRFLLEHLLLLPIGAAIAMAWVNLWPESYYDFTYRIAFAVNEVAMVLFFGLIAKEVVEATIPGGVLHHWRRTTVPVIAAVGATIAPALLYVQFVDWVDEPMLVRAWTVTFATDVALAYVVAKVIFPAHPAVPFVLLLALAADAFGFAAMALFFPVRDLQLTVAVVVMTAAIGVAAALRSMRMRSFWPYVLVGGSLSWAALYYGGFHPAFALLPIMPFLPHAARDPGFFVDARPDAKDALNRFELVARYPAQIALFFFALVNAGVPFRGLEEGTWGVPFATLIGKPLGILVAVGIAVLAGFHLPPRVGWRELTVAGVISAAGFTVALFFAAATLAPGILLRETKMGVLLGLISIAAAFALARMLRVGRFSQ
jgi:Na+:H+ antiporter, NhaA family